MDRIHEMPFALDMGASFFEKASAPDDKRRRVAGVLSAEEEDQQGEELIQDGLDFSYFMSKGFLNDHHDKTIAGIVGYPEELYRCQKGDDLPDGSLAKANCTWIEGRMLQDERSTAIWKKGLELQGTPRALGFSVEGKAATRDPLNKKKVTKALIWHAAITHMPVYQGSRASFLKSLASVGEASPEILEKAWKAFHRALRGHEPQRRLLNRSEAIAAIVARVPGISQEMAGDVFEVIERRRRK